MRPDPLRVTEEQATSLLAAPHSPPPREARDQGITVSQALDNVGAGRFHYMAGVACGVANAGDAIALLSISYILLDFPDVSSSAKGALSAAMFAGMLVGGSVAGMLSDKYGRKKTLLGFLGEATVFNLLASACPTWTYLAGARTLAGIGIGGQLPIVFNVYVELLPAKDRGYYLSIVSWFWAFGSIFTSGVAWLMVGYAHLPWRAFALVVAIPNLLACFLVWFLVLETPHFYAHQGRRDKAVQKLLQVAARCGPGRRSGLEDDPSRLVMPPPPPPEDDWVVQLKVLLSPRFRWRTIATFIVWFMLSFGWYGLILWLPSLFTKSHLHINPYQNGFLVAAANIPGNLCYTYTTDLVGRRILLTVAMVLACCCAAGLSASRSAPLTVALACLLNAVSMLGWNSLSALSTELFPTTSRGTAGGVASAFGRLGSMVAQFVFGWLIDVSVTALLLTGAGALLIGGVAAFTLPETKNITLPDAGTKDRFVSPPLPQNRDRRRSSIVSLPGLPATLDPDDGRRNSFIPDPRPDFGIN